MRTKASTTTRTIFKKALMISLIFFQCGGLCLTGQTLVATGPLKSYEYSLPRMGTVFRIVLYAPNATAASEASTDAFDRVEQLEQIFSDYRADSELVLACRAASQSPQRLSPDLFSILQKSLYFSELSEGAFDVTIGPVVKLWREARRHGRLPEAEQLSKARLAVGYRNVVLDPDARTLMLNRDGMSLDLGAIAKGYAADQALAVLNKHGIRCALIDAGGDLSLGDPPPGKRGWEIQVRSWTTESSAGPFWLLLHNVGIATSGDTFQFLEAKGQRFSHIIDPKDDLGVRDSASTTVIAPDGTAADALATALSILAVSKGLSLADSLEGVSTFLVRRHGGEYLTYSSRRFPPFSGQGPSRAGGEGHKAGSPPIQ